MPPHGRNHTVIMTHDAEALAQRREMIAGGYALVEVVNYDFGYIHIALGALQTAQTPLIIGRIAIAQVIIIHEFAQHDKCLMTHYHPVGKRLYRKHFGSFMMTSFFLSTR